MMAMTTGDAESSHHMSPHLTFSTVRKAQRRAFKLVHASKEKTFCGEKTIKVEALSPLQTCFYTFTTHLRFSLSHLTLSPLLSFSFFNFSTFSFSSTLLRCCAALDISRGQYIRILRRCHVLYFVVFIARVCTLTRKLYSHTCLDLVD